MCDDGWNAGWHERNGGNLTYRMTAEDVSVCRDDFCCGGEWKDMGVTAKNLADEFFLTTGSGKYFRNVKASPDENIGIIEISPNAEKYRIVWGLSGGGMPTSEFPSHFLNHSARLKVTGGNSRVIYHAHTPDIIALTYILPLTDKAFSRVLWQCATECPVVFPQGVGVVEWMVPGGANIAHASMKLMEKYEAVVWAHHGLFCAGADFDETFGLMHTIEKAAGIYLRILSSGKNIKQTITEQNLCDVAAAFGVEINKENLN